MIYILVFVIVAATIIHYVPLLTFQSQTCNGFVLFFYIDCCFCSPPVKFSMAENKNLAHCKQFAACTAHFNSLFSQFFDRNAIYIFLLILIRSWTSQPLEIQVNLVCPSNKTLLCYKIWQLCSKRLIGLSTEFFVTERLPGKTIYCEAETESDAT